MAQQQDDSALVERFLAELRRNEPDLAPNYVSVDPPTAADEPDESDSATIDGWWTVSGLAAAIRAAVADMPPDAPAVAPAIRLTVGTLPPPQGWPVGTGDE